MIAAILLAAGRSRRMGAFKPLLPFGGRSVAEACVENLLAGGAAEVVVVVGHRGDEVRQELSRLPVRFALNSEEESEMGASIARGVEQLAHETKAVLIALVDQPAIPPETIVLLNAAAEEAGARLVVPEYEGRGGHPVRVDLSFREELMNLDARGGLRALFAAHRGEVLRVPVTSPYVARDMDRWDDYLALHREVFGTEPKNSQQ
ncbi:MAG TPA: nucleotidyltransferase family protein [Pyrinomonadaceae bacterium]|nr:nucleotidyltransferase family protein [Pyrinomonadaceae bacterium]